MQKCKILVRADQHSDNMIFECGILAVRVGLALCQRCVSCSLTSSSRVGSTFPCGLTLKLAAQQKNSTNWDGGSRFNTEV